MERNLQNWGGTDTCVRNFKWCVCATNFVEIFVIRVCYQFTNQRFHRSQTHVLTHPYATFLVVHLIVKRTDVFIIIFILLYFYK